MAAQTLSQQELTCNSCLKVAEQLCIARTKLAEPFAQIVHVEGYERDTSTNYFMYGSSIEWVDAYDETQEMDPDDCASIDQAISVIQAKHKSLLSYLGKASSSETVQVEGIQRAIDEDSFSLEMHHHSLKHSNIRFAKYVIAVLTGSRFLASLEACASVLADENREARAFMAEKIEGFGPLAVPYLISALGDEEEEVRYHIVRSLGNIRDKRALDALIQSLSDPNENVRYYSIKSLGLIDDAKSILALIGKLTDQNSNVNYGAAEVLKQMGDERTLTRRVLKHDAMSPAAKFASLEMLRRVHYRAGSHFVLKYSLPKTLQLCRHSTGDTDVLVKEGAISVLNWYKDRQTLLRSASAGRWNEEEELLRAALSGQTLSNQDELLRAADLFEGQSHSRKQNWLDSIFKRS